MGSQAVIWSAVVILLFVLFVLREAIKMRKRVGNNKVLEFSDEFDLYDWED
ncbi:hypothetical protein HMPREF1870_02384 [Bacteroidales bacterium KA00344]|nr:hypothetical protein HMPREF1870_02384 [Bacteroidales bacterium KA00344]